MQSILDQVQLLIKELPHIKLCNIQMNEHENEFIINGKVSSYYFKQMAQETVMQHIRTKGLKINIKNKIVVEKF